MNDPKDSESLCATFSMLCVYHGSVTHSNCHLQEMGEREESLLTADVEKFCLYYLKTSGK